MNALCRGCATMLAQRPIVTMARTMSVAGVKSMDDREHALENMYFNKQEEVLLRKLLKKMKNQADKHDDSAPSHNSEQESKLEAIVKKYNMTPEDTEALRNWKDN